MMVLVDTSYVIKTDAQNNADASTSASSTRWNGRSVGLGALSTAVIAVAALSVLAVGANAYGSWIASECGYNDWGQHVCWLKECHIEETCTYLWGWASCYKEEVCTHFV